MDLFACSFGEGTRLLVTQSCKQHVKVQILTMIFNVYVNGHVEEHL